MKNRGEFLDELTELSRKHGIGISGGQLFPYESSTDREYENDYNNIYSASPSGELGYYTKIPENDISRVAEHIVVSDRLGDLSGFDWLNDKTLRFRDPDQDGSAWGQIEDESGNVVAEVDPILMMDVLNRIQWSEAIKAIPDLIAALKESRKEVEELRDNAQRAKTILQEEIESIEQDDGGRGCVTAMIDAIVELEGKQ